VQQLAWHWQERTEYTDIKLMHNDKGMEDERLKYLKLSDFGIQTGEHIRLFCCRQRPVLALQFHLLCQISELGGALDRCIVKCGLLCGAAKQQRKQETVKIGTIQTNESFDAEPYVKASIEISLASAADTNARVSFNDLSSARFCVNDLSCLVTMA
jgi:hypothetical protein